MGFMVLGLTVIALRPKIPYFLPSNATTSTYRPANKEKKESEIQSTNKIHCFDRTCGDWDGYKDLYPYAFSQLVDRCGVRLFPIPHRFGMPIFQNKRGREISNNFLYYSVIFEYICDDIMAFAVLFKTLCRLIIISGITVLQMTPDSFRYLNFQ